MSTPDHKAASQRPNALLREPFPASQVGKLPRKGITLDYVGHGAVTDRLLTVDPTWNWEPLALDERGLPAFTLDANGNPIALWIKLTVAGVTRLGCGTCNANQADAEKVLIGDAIRNAAMRFGVALDLWIRGHAEDDEKRTEGATSSTQRRGSEPAPFVSPDNAAALRDKCAALGVDVAEAVRLATNGRTEKPEEVRTNEVRAVKEAVDNLTPAGAA